MTIFCLEEFKKEVEKLVKNNSYSHLEKEIINHFFDKPIEDLRSGTLLNPSSPNHFIKKRLEGSGGYRVYFYIILKNDCLYLMYVHPKTGKFGGDNITNEKKKDILDKVIEAIKIDDFFEIKPDSTNTKLEFRKMKTNTTSSKKR